MLLITGCGRSGTHFTARLLQEMGLDVGHETIGKDGVASWKHIVSGTFVYVGKNRTQEIRDEKFTSILHQVRHPLKVIASMQTFGPSTWGFMAQFISLDLKTPVIARAMQGWVEWNRLIERRAHWRFQIEQLEFHFDEFCRQIGMPPRPMPTIAHSAKDSRTGRYAPLYWQDLVKADAALAEQVRQLALSYSYADLSIAPPPAQKSEYKAFGFLRRFFSRPIELAPMIALHVLPAFLTEG